MPQPKRPDYGNATPEDVARALMRPVGPRQQPKTGDQPPIPAPRDAQPRTEKQR